MNSEKFFSMFTKLRAYQIFMDAPLFDIFIFAYICNENLLHIFFLVVFRDGLTEGRRSFDLYWQYV